MMYNMYNKILSQQKIVSLGTFMEKLKELVDRRDKRGKKHDLDFVLASVALAILAGRSRMSSIHRFIENRIDWLREILDRPEAEAVSRAQLPRILAGVDQEGLAELMRTYLGLQGEIKEEGWYALDGKTMRGIAGQQDRVLLAVSHQEQQTVAQEAMLGPKSSEITTVREVLAQTGLEKSRITLDALHFNPQTTQQIHQAGGTFIIQLKANQTILFDQMSQVAAETVPLHSLKTEEKGHGRLETRQAVFFDIADVPLAPRWQESGFRTLIVVSRRRLHLATNKTTAEISFYLSNELVSSEAVLEAQTLWVAIRNHWAVEAENHIRDVTFNEDQVKTKAPSVGLVLASLRTFASSLLRQAQFTNFQAALETFSDKPAAFLSFLQQTRFL